MGDLNQLDFVDENRLSVKGPILEVGSKDYGNANNFRLLFEHELYIGTDQEPGKGVDVVCDFTADYASIIDQVGIEKFGTIICFSVLEHCKNPFKMAENISKFLIGGGTLFVSVPFVWNIHSYPDDYWRFTPSSLSILFPDCMLVEEKSFYSTKIRGERFPFSTNLPDQERFTFTISIMIRVLQKLHLARAKYPYVLFPVMVNASLIKKSQNEIS
jgi:hypothetical protein